jgi:hypothetical protein
MNNSIVSAIIEKLKTGSIPNVFLFSDIDVIPKVPYVMVKPETGVIENTRQFRIIAHENTGQYAKLQNYILKECDSLLLGDIYDGEGTKYKLYANGYTDVTPEVDDNTYFAERVYYTPLRID